MATFFGRRYMRGGEQVSRTEKVIGAACLLVAACVAVGFVRHAMTPRPAFFAVDPEKHPEAIPAEVRHAWSLLPESPAPGWARAEPVEVIEPEHFERAMPGESGPFVEAGVRRMYQGRYLNRVDARQQVTAQVFDMGTADAAAAVFDAIRPSDALGEPVGARGWRSEDGTVCFRAGRYLNVIRSTNVPEESTLTPRLLAREVADRQVAYDVFDREAWVGRTVGGVEDRRDKPGGSLPTPEGGVWAAPEGVTVYTPGNLWEKINGRAEQYLAFDCARMIFGTYRMKNEPTLFVDCYVYEMGDGVKAFGIYRLERPSHVDAIEIGEEGYRGAGSLFFRTGRYYVQLVGGDEGEAPSAALEALARAVAAPLAETTAAMWAEEVLPREGQVEGSFVYFAQDALNLDFLRDVFAADYEFEDGSRMMLFVHRAEDAAAAAGLMEQYAEYAGRLGRVIGRETAEEGEEMAADFGGEYDIVFTRGRYFGGASGASDLEAGRRQSAALREALKKIEQSAD